METGASLPLATPISLVGAFLGDVVRTWRVILIGSILSEGSTVSSHAETSNAEAQKADATVRSLRGILNMMV